MIARLVFSLVLLCGTAASAQRAPRERWTPPVTPVLVGAGEGPYDVLLGFRTSGDVEVVTDWRRFELDVHETTPGRRRPRVHRCQSGARVGRREASSAVQFHAGDAWGIAIDLRSLCWGRALRAVEAGAAIVVRYAVGRARGAWIARGPNGELAREVLAPTSFVVRTEAADASSGITLAPVDARSRRFSFRVAVFGPDEAVRRAWVRPDAIRFQVVDPEGARWECALPSTGAAPIPDLFARISRRRAVRFALDAAEYCPDVFRRAGVYDVTPVAVLEEDGATWRLNAVVGRFVGRPVAVRVRGGEGTPFTELSLGEARSRLR